MPPSFIRMQPAHNEESATDAIQMPTTALGCAIQIHHVSAWAHSIESSLIMCNPHNEQSAKCTT
eukprot:4830502-Ditylum_brightwellii.AAC.1